MSSNNTLKLHDFLYQIGKSHCCCRLLVLVYHLKLNYAPYISTCCRDRMARQFSGLDFALPWPQIQR
jgi:hypothetical protein